MSKQLKIRNSTAEFLIFTKQNETNAIDVMVADDNVWLTQDMIAILYDKARSTIAEHLQELFSTGEIDNIATCRKFRQVQMEGVREVGRERLFYNLEVIIALGYKVNSERAILFRKWATAVLKEFALKGYVLDRGCPENQIRNCHINIGTGKEITIAALAELIINTVGYKGELRFDAEKPDGTMRKLTDPSKLHALGSKHQIEEDKGVKRLYDWYIHNL